MCKIVVVNCLPDFRVLRAAGRLAGPTRPVTSGQHEIIDAVSLQQGIRNLLPVLLLDFQRDRILEVFHQMANPYSTA